MIATRASPDLIVSYVFGRGANIVFCCVNEHGLNLAFTRAAEIKLLVPINDFWCHSSTSSLGSTDSSPLSVSFCPERSASRFGIAVVSNARFTPAGASSSGDGSAEVAAIVAEKVYVKNADTRDAICREPMIEPL